MTEFEIRKNKLLNFLHDNGIYDDFVNGFTTGRFSGRSNIDELVQWTIDRCVLGHDLIIKAFEWSTNRTADWSDVYHSFVRQYKTLSVEPFDELSDDKSIWEED